MNSYTIQVSEDTDIKVETDIEHGVAHVYIMTICNGRSRHAVDVPIENLHSFLDDLRRVKTE